VASQSPTTNGRDLRRTAVLALLGKSGPMSRVDIAREMNVSPATITQVTKRLLEQRLVEEVAQRPSNGGRPAQLLALVGSAGRAIGVKVAADHVVTVDVRMDGEVLDVRQDHFDATSPRSVEVLCRLLRERVRNDDALPSLLGVGVCVPGVVDSPESGVVNSPVLGWNRLPVGPRLRAELGIPVLVENDVNALGVAELLYGRGQNISDFFVLTIGRGVGLAIVLDGQLYRGSRGGAGEFGHLPVERDGPACSCGNKGCLEALVGGPALVAEARRRGVLTRGQRGSRLPALAELGNQGATELFHDAGQTLGFALAGLINVLDPAALFVAGEGTEAWSHWAPGFEEALDAHLLAPMRGLPVHVEPWDDSRWAQGAAALVLATPFDASAATGSQTQQVLARIGVAE
jgi:predicted NBD/HSP70 family sugar kinase